MKILQIVLLSGLILYIIFSSINFMEQYSETAKADFRAQRNWNIGFTIFLGFILYWAGTFSLIFP